MVSELGSKKSVSQNHGEITLKSTNITIISNLSTFFYITHKYYYIIFDEIDLLILIKTIQIANTGRLYSFLFLTMLASVGSTD